MQNIAAQFVYLILSPEELNQFYNFMTSFTGTEVQREQRLSQTRQRVRGTGKDNAAIIKGLISNEVGGKVLDIGCRVHFLDNAGSSWEKYGIELSEEARRLPRGKGLQPLKRLKKLLFLRSSSMW